MKKQEKRGTGRIHAGMFPVKSASCKERQFQKKSFFFKRGLVKKGNPAYNITVTIIMGQMKK